MQTGRILYIFGIIGTLFCPIWAQEEAGAAFLREEKYDWNDWQMQILEKVDPDEMDPANYEQLLEMLYDLEIDEQLLHPTDSTRYDGGRLPLRQVLLVGGDRCLNRQKGYRNNDYQGDPNHIGLRYNMKLKDRKRGQWQGGLVLDKDAGEPWERHPPFADSFSLFASYSRSEGWLRKAYVGHYRVSLGSGLLCNQGFSLGKNLLGTCFFQKKKSLSAHSSASEANHMQGGAMQVRLGEHCELTGFLSALQIDGNLAQDTLTSWSQTGLHRTTHERAQKQVQWLTTSGAQLKWMGEWWELSGNVLYNQLQHTFQRPLRSYNQNYFRGHQLFQSSVNYEVRWADLVLKGETAMDDGGGWAMIHGIRSTLWNSWKLSVLYRQYSNQYRQLMGSSLSESSAMQGERGETLALEGVLSTHWRLQTSADLFQFTQPQYGINTASNGYEISAKTIYDKEQGGNRWQGTVSYRLKAKYKNRTTGDAQGIIPYYRHSISSRLQWNTQSGWTLRSQLHLRFYSAESSGGIESGYAVAQSVGWNKPEQPLRAEIQGVWFHTDSYDSRLYVAEKNVLYGFNIPMLNGEGVRLSCALSYRPLRFITIEAKYARTTYRNRSTVGTGLQSIEGNHQDNVWLQTRFKF